MFWKFIFKLVIGDVLSIIAFSLVVVASVAPLALAAKSQTAAKFLAISVAVMAGAAQIYFWGLWAAFCSGLAAKHAAMPSVSHAWIYYVVAFAFSAFPLCWLLHKERQTVESAEEQRAVHSGAWGYIIFAEVAFIVFCIWPSLADWPYSWALSRIV